MAVFWLVFYGAKGQMPMLLVLATPARGRWVNQCLGASLSSCKEEQSEAFSNQTHESIRKACGAGERDVVSENNDGARLRLNRRTFAQTKELASVGSLVNCTKRAT